MTDEPSVSRDLLTEFDENCDTKVFACSICYENVAGNKNSCVTECGHQFCFGCIMRTIKSNTATSNCCPICRTAMFERDESESESDSDSESESEDDELPKASIDQITRRLQSECVLMSDLVALLLGRYDDTFTKEYVDSMDILFDSIVNREDSRIRRQVVDRETSENSQMGIEDNIESIVTNSYVFDDNTDFLDDDGCLT